MLQRLLLYGFLLLIFLGGGYSLWVAQQEIGTSEPVDLTVSKEVENIEDGMVGENVTFTVTESDHKKWELSVKKAIYFKDRSGATLSGVSGQFFDEQGKVIARFTAPNGRYNTEKKAITLTNGVSVTSNDGSGSGINAPKVVWSSKAENITASGGVHLKLGHTAAIRASQCQFNLDFSKVSLIGAVHSAVGF